MTTKLFDHKIASSEEQALDFIGNILESSTEYSIIGKDLELMVYLFRAFGYSQRREPYASPGEPASLPPRRATILVVDDSAINLDRKSVV